MGHEEAVLPRVGFGEIEIHFTRIEGLEPAAILPRPRKACFRIKHVAVKLRALDKRLVILVVIQQTAISAMHQSS